MDYMLLKRWLTIIRRDASREHQEWKCFSFLYCTTPVPGRGQESKNGDQNS